MVRFVMLTTFTEVGASQIQDTTRRAQMLAERAAAMGVTFETLLWTLGEIDAVVIVSAPDEGSVVALSTFLAKQGYVRTRLLRAFTEGEFAAILGRMPGGTITLDAD
jgi:uncharacterized protein with GYD domain